MFRYAAKPRRGKKIVGRQWRIVIDTPGLILAEPTVQNRDGARLILPKLVGGFKWLAAIPEN